MVSRSSAAPNLPKADLQDRLLTWFSAHARVLPWRAAPTLYGTWISEIMLQQTTVATVIPYWRRFLSRFPDVQALARAELDEVLSLWTGLGYYRRARQLHAAARTIVEKHDGRLPTDREGWLRLPGIGPYAGGAIASIGLGVRAAALDANARRVIQRWACGDLATLERLTPRALTQLAEDLVPADRPGVWNEAIMELGALICRARNPRCADCPVSTLCRAAVAGLVAEVPRPPAPAEVLAVRTAVLVVKRGPQILLLPPGSAAVTAGFGERAIARREFGTLHRGLWGLPMSPWYASVADAVPRLTPDGWSVWVRQCLPGLPVAAAETARAAGEFSHAITRFRLRVAVHLLSLPTAAGVADSAPLVGRFQAAGRSASPVSQLVVKALRRAGAIPG